MKLLLDECTNQNLRHHLTGHDVSTVTYLGWNGIANGRLLSLALLNNFDALITTDRGFPYQHNPDELDVAVVCLHPKGDGLPQLLKLILKLLDALSKLQPRTFLVIRP